MVYAEQPCCRNAAVCTPATLKADLVVARQEVGSAARILFRLLLLYQPAGSGEKEIILKNLHTPQPAKTPLEAQQALRNWSRWEARARAVGLVLPDPSILARSLTAILSVLMGSNQDLAFKLTVARQALRLDQNPTMDRLLAYHRHALAEVDALVTHQGHAAGLQLKALNTPTPTPKSASKPLCKYSLSEKGCKKPKCAFVHDMSGLDKPTRSKKCLKCGSESHRAKECPLASSNKGNKRGDGTDPGSLGSQGSATSPVSPGASSLQALRSGISEEVSQVPYTVPHIGQAPSAAASSGVSAQNPGIQGAISGNTAPSLAATAIAQAPTTPGQATNSGVGATLLDALICEAGLALNTQQRNSPSLNVLQLGTTSSSKKQEESALADSGATHALRPPKSSQEWVEAVSVPVQLAGSQETILKISSGGSLLHPNPTDEGTGNSHGPEVILPLGQIIQKLGYKLNWTAEACTLTSPSGKKHHLSVSKGCPHLSVNEALSLIVRLEERNLQASVQTLEAACVKTQHAVEVSKARITRTWFQWLETYAVSGRAADAAIALQEAPFLARDESVGMLPDQEHKKGWSLLRGLHAYSRQFRKRLHSAKNVVLHLFSGSKDTPDVQVPEDCVLLSLDIRKCVTESVSVGPTWDAVVWAARAGKISHIIGAPPRAALMQALEVPERWDDAKHNMEIDLITRMVVLHALATSGRKAHPDTRHRTAEVGFLVQYPEFKHPTSHILEHTMGGFWASELWSIYKQEAGLAKVQIFTPGSSSDHSHS